MKMFNKLDEECTAGVIMHHVDLLKKGRICYLCQLPIEGPAVVLAKGKRHWGDCPTATMPTSLAANPYLLNLLEQAKKIVVTPAMLWDQRVSFAYGNASLHNPAITREMVVEQAVKIYGPRPEEK